MIKDADLVVVDVEDAWDFILEAAQARHIHFTKPRQLANDGHFEVMGCAGEFALQRWLGMEAFARITLPASDPGVDLFWNGRSLGMRTSNWKTNWRGRCLQSPAYRKRLPDACVFGLLRGKMVVLVGWAPGRSLLAAPVVPAFNPCHQIPAERLVPMGQLELYLQRRLVVSQNLTVGS